MKIMDEPNEKRGDITNLSTLNQICEENQSLRKQLEEAKEEIEHQKNGRIIAENDRTRAIQSLFKSALSAGWKEYHEKGGDHSLEAWSPSGDFNLIDDIAEDLPEVITDLRAELTFQKEAAKQLGDEIPKLIALINQQEIELAKNKAAREWVDKFGNDTAQLLERVGCGKGFEAYDVLRALSSTRGKEVKTIDKKKLKALEREADIATIACFAAKVQLNEAESAFRTAEQNHQTAYDNFIARKNAYLLAKCADAKVEDFVKQGISVSLKENPNKDQSK